MRLGNSLNERADSDADSDAGAVADRSKAARRPPRSQIRIVKERPGPISRSPGLLNFTDPTRAIGRYRILIGYHTFTYRLFLLVNVRSERDRTRPNDYVWHG